MGMYENEIYDQIYKINKNINSDLISKIEEGVNVYLEQGSELYHDDGDTLSKYPNVNNDKINKNMAELKGVVFHNEGGDVRIVGKEYRALSEFVKALILITKARGLNE